MKTKLELLSPAKNANQGIAAIDHGADAVYIGAPLFGARVAAGNSIEDIEQLVKHAHLFGSKVFTTVNTLLFDNELEAAEKMIWNLYNIGVDAVIVQDMGLLELNLPPIELHASTQTHNIDPQRIKFLEQVGFKRIILAREMSLEQMASLRSQTTVDLEAFVQGALCVCYSGQCYLSQYLTGRSGNRGACSQPCRSSYDLINESGTILRHNEHLLSLKDFSAAKHIAQMIDAGITSFKIEGRLKDMSYVKNITAYYRRLLDNLIEQRNDLRASSSGHTLFHFVPDPSRTFNRGFTDYFLVQRQPMASHSTQKSIGKHIGSVVESHGNRLTVKTSEALSAGDGLCYYNSQNQLEGFLVNQVNGKHITANKPLNIASGTPLWRNNDIAFERQLQGKSAERKMAVSMHLAETPSGLQLTISDEDGCQVSVETACEKVPANNPSAAAQNIEQQLRKLGGTPFKATDVTIQMTQPLFIVASQLNELRRNAIEQLETERLKHFYPKDKTLVPNNLAYPQATLDYRANIINYKAEDFYRRHQVRQLEHGLEKTLDYDGKALMTCKYCLHYELGQCLKLKNNKTVAPNYRSTLYLCNGNNRFRLQFDCEHCEMQIYADTAHHQSTEQP
ncbi:MAG: U32 family peptidase [Bacteroidales bacterium]|nr:U32 family peptidase [Bacteroidales bacterium]